MDRGGEKKDKQTGRQTEKERYREGRDGKEEGWERLSDK